MSIFSTFNTWLGVEQENAQQPQSTPAPYPEDEHAPAPAPTVGGGYSGSPPPSGHPAVASRPKAVASVVPEGPPVDVGALCGDLRKLADKRMKDAWGPFREEFSTLLKIWESQDALESMQPPELHDKAGKASKDRIRAAVEQALAASASDPVNATSLLVPLLGKQDDPGPGFNKGCEEKGKAILKAKQLYQMRLRLTESLSAASGKCPSEDEKKESEGLVKTCSLGEALESKARRVLGLPPSKAELQKVKAAQEEALRKEKAKQKEAHDAKIAQLAKASGVSRENAAKALHNANGDLDFAAVMLLSEKDADRNKKIDAARAKQEAAKEKRIRDVTECASIVTRMADSTVSKAWDKVRVEWKTQIKLWDSQAALGNNRSYGSTDREVSDILLTAASDCAQAAQSLDWALHKGQNRGLNVGNGVLIAVATASNADQLAQCRWELAKLLEEFAGRLLDGLGGYGDAELVQTMTLINTSEVDPHFADRLNTLLFGK